MSKEKENTVVNVIIKKKKKDIVIQKLLSNLLIMNCDVNL